MDNKIMVVFPFLFVSAGGGCAHKPSRRLPYGVPVVSARPEAVVLDTAGAVTGYETCTHMLPVAADGTYTVAVSSENTGFAFVLRDADGNKVTRETYRAWTGKLKKGHYTITVGLMRYVPRIDRNAVRYTVEVKRR